MYIFTYSVYIYIYVIRNEYVKTSCPVYGVLNPIVICLTDAIMPFSPRTSTAWFSPTRQGGAPPPSCKLVYHVYLHLFTNHRKNYWKTIGKWWFNGILLGYTSGND